MTAASLAAAFLFVTGAVSMSVAKTFVYVSNAQDGNIDAYVMDTGNGALTPIGKTDAAKLVMPMAVSPNKKTLYAVIRSQPVRVLSYAIDPASGKLTQKASAPLPDSMPYVSTDRTGRFLFTASYGGDKIAVSPIGENGLVEAEAIQVIPTGRNAHSVLPDPSNKFVYAATLGANQVLQFTFDSTTGKLTPNHPAAVSPDAGHGPRHMVFSPNSKNLYVLNELSGHVTQYAIDAGKGTLTLVDSINWYRRRQVLPGARHRLLLAPPPRPRRPRMTNRKSGQPISKSRPTANSCTQPSARPTRSPCSRWHPIRASLLMSPTIQPRLSRAGSGSIRRASISLPLAKSRTACRCTRSIRLQESLASPLAVRSEMVRTG
jgi:hypothetical protein